MAALAETRDVGSRLALPATVRRFCCIGDSLTYGQGVAPRQTLSMHVARFANMVYFDQLVWVDNLGQSSGNLWHSWVPFTRLAESIRFDAVVFSLCQNDAQIFESNTVSYGNDVERTWLADGRCHPFVRETIADIAAFAARRDIHILLDFYSSWETDRPLIDALQRECRAANLPFLDILRFVQEESGLSAVEFRASPFDGHPSDAAHRLVARRIVEELRDTWSPKTRPYGTVAERLVEACAQAVENGWSPDDITHWALTVIEAKQTVARRRRSASDRAALGDLEAAKSTIQQRYGSWYAKSVAATGPRFHREERESLALLLERGYSSLRNLDEMIFILEQFQRPEESASLWALLDRSGYYNEPGRLQALPVNAKAQYLALASRPRAAGSCFLSPRSPNYDLRGDLNHNLRRLAALLPDKVLPRTFDPCRRHLWELAHYLADAARSYLDEFDTQARTVTVDVQAPPAPADMPAPPAFYTVIDVRIERDRQKAKRGGVFSLTVEGDYIVPQRVRRSEKLWAGADEEIHVYRFELPLMLLGDLGVGVPQWDEKHRLFLEGELRIASIDVSNGSAEVDAPRRGFHWKPATDAAPSHWINLERLQVAG